MESEKELEVTEVTEETKTEGAPEETKVTEVEKTFTQNEVEELIKKRLERANKKFEKQLEELKKPSEEELSAEEKLSELEKLIAAKNQKILNYEAGKIARDLNVKPERVDAVLKLADLSAVEINEEGEFDIDELKETIGELAKSYPEFFTEAKKNEGFIKVGEEPKQQPKEDELMAQIMKGLGM